MPLPLRIIRADLARSIESRQVCSSSDSGHKVEPKRPPLGAIWLPDLEIARVLSVAGCRRRSPVTLVMPTSSAVFKTHGRRSLRVLRRGRLADKVPRLAEGVWEVRWPHRAAELWTEPPECTIGVPVVLPVEVLKEFLPRPRRAADERFHLLCDCVLRHGRHAGWRVTRFERG
jgi:hypothetical protein